MKTSDELRERIQKLGARRKKLEEKRQAALSVLSHFDNELIANRESMQGAARALLSALAREKVEELNAQELHPND